MKAYFDLPEALIEDGLIAVGPLNGIQQVYVIRHGYLKQCALDFDFVGHRVRELVIGTADIGAIHFLAIRGRAARAFEFQLIEQRCFGMGHVRDFIHRYAQLVGRGAAGDVQLATTHADDVGKC